MQRGRVRPAFPKLAGGRTAPAALPAPPGGSCRRRPRFAAPLRGPRLRSRLGALLRGRGAGRRGAVVPEQGVAAAASALHRGGVVGTHPPAGEGPSGWRGKLEKRITQKPLPAPRAPAGAELLSKPCRRCPGAAPPAREMRAPSVGAGPWSAQLSLAVSAIATPSFGVFRKGVVHQAACARIPVLAQAL